MSKPRQMTRDVGTYRPAVMTRAQTTLQDATQAVAAMVMALKGRAARGEANGKDAKALLDLLSALQKIDELEQKTLQNLNLQNLTDAELRQRALDALNALPAPEASTDVDTE